MMAEVDMGGAILLVNQQGSVEQKSKAGLFPFSLWCMDISWKHKLWEPCREHGDGFLIAVVTFLDPSSLLTTSWPLPSRNWSRRSREGQQRALYLQGSPPLSGHLLFSGKVA